MTCIPQPQSQIPTPQPQTKITRNHGELTQIPTLPNPTQIQQLYLSHNQIKTVRGLSEYTQLRSLNLSYNCLDSVEELLGELKGIKKLKRLSVRMNLLPYGYEDRVIGELSALERLDDIELMPYERRRKIEAMSKAVSDDLVRVFVDVGAVMACMERLLGREVEQQREIAIITPFSLDQHPNIKQILNDSLPLSIISSLSPYLKQQDKKTHLPQNPANILGKMQKILNILGQIKNPSLTNDYIGACNQQFRQILRIILLKFSQRNNYTLIKHLSHANTTDYKQSHFQQIVENFWDLAGHRYSIDDDGGRYLQIINSSSLEKYPINKYLQYKIENCNTLDGEGRTRYGTLMSTPTKDVEKCYEKISIYIYQRNYLEIIYEIIIQKVKALIKLYDQTKNISIDQLKQQQQPSELKISPKIHKSKVELTEKSNNKYILIQTDSDNLTTETQERKTIPKLRNTPSTVTFRKTEPKTQKYKKYSTYEIKLAYKVLIGLKKYQQKRKNRRLK